MMYFNNTKKLFDFDKKILKAMRLSILLLLFGTIQAYASASLAQQVRLHKKGITVKKVFKELRKQTNTYFMYQQSDVDEKRKIDVDFNNVNLVQALNEICSQISLKYEIIDDYVLLTKQSELKTVKNAETKPLQESYTITGKITDEEGDPLPGASIMVKGSTTGTISNLEGNYTLEFHKENAELVFGFVGMITQTVAYTGQKVINISMKKQENKIDDVVITGYFDKSKANCTGAVTQISKKEIQQYGNTNILTILSQIDPTFTTEENNNMGSNPNKLPDFFIRGEGSFMGGSNLPTFIVDGNEVSLQYIFDMDIERIESLSILKDASATIYYGSRAANGVVVIETRRPKPGELRVNYTNRTGFSAPDLSDYNLMNAKEKLEFEKLAGVYTSEDPKEQARLDKVYNDIATDVAKGVDTYWLSQPLRNALSHSHSLYVSGGDNKVTYGLSANYNNKSGVMKQSDRNTYGLAFDLTYRIIDKITIRNSLSYYNTKSENSPYGSFSNYARANPYSPIDVKDFNQHNTYVHFNYLYNAKLAHKDESNINTIINNTSLDWWLFNKLRLKSSLSLSKTLKSGEQYKSPLSTIYNGVAANKKGYARVSNGDDFSYDFSTTLNYTINIERHSIYTGAGVNIQQIQNNSNDYSVSGFLDERFNDIRFALQFAEGTKPNSVDQQSRLIGLMGNLNYSFDSRYFVDFSMRSDGSSKYGSNKRFGMFWSLGVGWNIHKEAFMENLSFLEELKLRGSVGETGNQNFDPRVAKTIYEYYTTNFYYQSLGAYFTQFGNENLEWQKSFKQNIGLDLMFMNRRLSLNFDYYNDKTLGLLLPVTVAPSLGFSSYTENYGEQLNTGFEFRLSFVALRKKDFDLAFFVSGLHNRNKIVKISNVLAKLNETNNADASKFTKPVSLYEEGESLTAIKVVKSLGIDPETGKELYLTKDGKITDVWSYKDKVKMGDTSPLIIGNFGTNIMWKQFSLNANFRYSVGGQLYNTTLAERVEGANPYVNADKRVLNERWKKPGDKSFYKDIADRSVSNASSRFVQDNNYLEFSNISLFYRFNNELIKKYGIKNLRIGLNMNDVFYLSTIKRERGLDYPYARQFTFTLNLNF